MGLLQLISGAGDASEEPSVGALVSSSIPSGHHRRRKNSILGEKQEKRFFMREGNEHLKRPSYTRNTYNFFHHKLEAQYFLNATFI